MLNRLKKCTWQIAIRKRSNALLFEDKGRDRDFSPIKNTLRYWCADPFLVDYNGHKYLFFELYDRLKRKGLIGYREIIDGKIGKIHKAYETCSHLSYPFIFEKDSRLYIIPESNNLNKIVLLRNESKSSRLKFKQVDIILDNVAVVDATFFSIDSKNYMFATPVNNLGNSNKLNLYCYRNGEWDESECNPIISDKSSARMAGKIIFLKENDEVVRCSQDCSVTYGGALNFLKIEQFDGAYCEQLFLKLAPKDVHIKSIKEYDGIHTYNFDDEYEVIDFKKNDVVSFIEGIGYLLEKLHLTKKIRRKNDN